MKVLLLGGTGLLGSHLAKRLPESFPTCVAVRPEIDAIDEGSVRGVIDEVKPAVIVNAIGLKVGVQAALNGVNAVFPRRLASIAERAGARVVHVSTDAVFSGAQGNHRESDEPDPVDEYGRTKLAGELGSPHLTIRTSFFGRSPRGDGLVEWAIAQRGRSIEGFLDYRFTGLSAALLADLVVAAIGARAPLEGVYHVGGEPVSKHELLAAIGQELHLDLRVVPVGSGKVDRTLNADRFFAALGRQRPTLAESVATLGSCGVLSRS